MKKQWQAGIHHESIPFTSCPATEEDLFANAPPKKKTLYTVVV